MVNLPSPVFRVRCKACSTVVESWHPDFKPPEYFTSGPAICQCGQVSIRSVGPAGLCWVVNSKGAAWQPMKTSKFEKQRIKSSDSGEPMVTIERMGIIYRDGVSSGGMMQSTTYEAVTLRSILDRLNKST